MQVTTTAAALSASDQWMLMTAPSTPMVTPLPARRPRVAVLKRPTTLPRTRGGARTWTRVWAIDVNDVQHAGEHEERHRHAVAPGRREEPHRDPPETRADDRAPGARAQGVHALEEHGAEHGARRVGGEEHAVPGARLVGAEVVRVLRHLRLERVADEERRDAAEHDHRDDAPVGADLAEDA